MKSALVSVVIVTYHDTPFLLDCLKTFTDPAILEIIVVDNNELALKLPAVVKHLHGQGNIGYGPAVNLGARVARGKYLFILNPDTLVQKNALTALASFLDSHMEVGIVAPLLLDEHRQIYPLQGTLTLTPWLGVLSLSFLNKYVSLKRFWLRDWNKITPRPVEVVPGTAFLIRADLFRKIGGFDDHIFIYFEEHDLCVRVRRQNYKIFILPEAKIVHFWGQATPNQHLNRLRMQNSRFYYFRKHYGLASALIVELFARMSIENLSLMGIFILATVLRVYKLDQAPHFADMDWFFESANAALHTGHLPLLGITSSITWLHQGPLWTYFLLVPINPQVLTVSAGIITVILAYFSGGLMAAALIALLPFSITQSQTAYHTSLIPFLFFVVYLLIQRQRSFLAGLFIGFLYQSHLLTFIYWPLWLYLTYKNRINTPKLILGFVLGILPFILAGPIQTLGIFIWFAKQLLTGFGGVSAGISTAYWVVLMPGLILALAKVLKSIYAHWHSTDQK